MRKNFLLMIPIIVFVVLASLGEPVSSVKPEQAENIDEYYDLVIFGVDRRPYQKKGRSDVMLIIHCEPGRITFFSITRDKRVPVRRRRDKINHAFAYGGPRLAKATIENFLKFIQHPDVRSVVMPDRIIGCPHEEGIDYPTGENCPMCSFWEDRNSWTGEKIE